jgi:alpha-1,4-digalacturonate transport system permease protein
MAIGSSNPRRRVLRATGIYLLLGAVGLVMVFPFLYVVAGSLKTRADMFSYPPTLLPTTDITAEVDGEERSVFMVEGQEMVLLGDEFVGVYAPPDDLEATVEAPESEVGRVGGFVDQESVQVDGEELLLYEVPIDGQATEVVQVDRRQAGRFVPVDGGEEVVVALGEASAVTEVEAQTGNFAEVLQLQNLDRSLTNTILVTVLVVGGTVLTSIMGGFAFARLRFPGRDTMFLVYIGSIMIPFVILIVPLYQVMNALGWVDSLAALVFPFVVNAYGTFLMRQFFVSIPGELEEAARVDGASTSRILWRIFVPLSTPAIATLSTFMFLYSWNSFVWPFIIINAGNRENHVLTLSLQQLGGRAADTPNLVLAAVVMAVAVPVTVFVLAQRYFVENVATSGLK